MRMFSPKIIITGSSLSGNKGSMAMTLVFVEEIRRMIPGCQISLVSKYPKQDRSVADRIGIDLVPAPPVKLVTLTLLRAWLSVVFKFIPTSRWSDPVLLAYQRSDLLVDLGGVTFSGDRDWRGLLLSIAFLTPALAVGLPAAKLAQAMGPFNRGIVKITAKFFLSRCALLVARGIYTGENLRNLLGPDACHQCSDLAFLLKPSKTKEVSAYLDANGLPVDGFVGMSASAVVERKAKAERLDYKTTMVQLIKHAVAVTGMPVVLIPHSWPQGESKSEDLELAYELFERSECQEQVKIVKDDIDAKMLKAIISRSEILISSRFHSMIAALGTGVPTMVVGWSHKYREVMREVACEAYVCDFRKADFNTVSTLFNHLWENRHAIRKNIERRLPSLKDSAQQNLILLEKLLLCKAGHGKK